MPYLKQSTSQVIRFGPCLDKTDGVTEETGLTLAQADMRLSKDGGAFAQKNASGNASHDSDGWYSTTLDATDTATIGELILNVHQPANMLPVWSRWYVVEEDVYEFLLASGSTPDADIAAILVDTSTTLHDQIDGLTAGSGGSVNINAVSDNVIRDTIDNSGAAVDLGGGTVGIPITGHAFNAGEEVTITGTDSYDGSFDIVSQTTNQIVITSSFTIETFSSSDTVNSSVQTIVFIGTQASGTFVDTATLGGVNHVFTDVGDDIDVIYRYQVGGGRSATAVNILANVDGNNDDMSVSAYDFGNTQWDLVGTLTGSGSGIAKSLDLPLLLRHTGTGADLGSVFIRLEEAAGSTPSDLDVDRVLVSAVTIGQTIGYANASIWIDSVNGVAGTETFVNGVADNPVKGLPDAFTLSTALNLKNFVVTPGSSVTFAASPGGFIISAPQATLDGGSQDAAGCRIDGGLIKGTWTHSSGSPFLLAVVNMGPGGQTVSLESHVLLDCGIGGTIKLTSTDNIFWIGCFPTGTPILDFNSVGGATASIVDQKGPLTVINMASGDVLNAHFADGGILTIGGADGTANITGSCQVTDNRTGSPTLTQTGDVLEQISTRAKGIAKNAAHNDLAFLMVASNDHFTGKTGLTVAGTRSIDAGAFSAVSGTITEVANGMYQLDATAADLNGEIITFRFTGTDADDRYLTVKTSS